ncbi:putative protein RRP5 [Paratrimastix pyriformis]|uniref:Uncharacterized protein n=1 Tax=Paratrimastix pyriformis TaxID=342808 RepID=A0ABQ8U154_9EUKA|nr:putative protein RRP5 [Paratrimastix pyriformis]
MFHTQSTPVPALLHLLPPREDDFPLRYGPVRACRARAGRLTFERLLQSMPKRTDLWAIYLDMEERHGTQESIRALYERVIALSMNMHKMRFFFNRYRQYEASHGTPDRVRHVEERAQQYVATHTKDGAAPTE